MELLYLNGQAVSAVLRRQFPDVAICAASRDPREDLFISVILECWSSSWDKHLRGVNTVVVYSDWHTPSCGGCIVLRFAICFPLYIILYQRYAWTLRFINAEGGETPDRLTVC